MHQCISASSRPWVIHTSFGATSRIVWVSSSQSAWSEMTSGSSTLRCRARWRIRIQPDAIAVTGSGSRRDQRSLSAPGGQMMILPCELVLGRAGRRPQLAERHAQLLVEPAQPLHRAVIVDRLVMPARAQLDDHPLRLAQRIGADQHAALRLGVEPVEQPVDLAAGVGMAEHRQAEGRLGDEDVARHRHERRAGRVGAALVVARHDHPLAVDTPGRSAPTRAHGRRERSRHRPRRSARSRHRPTGRACLLAVAHVHDRQRFRRRPHLAMAAAGMVGMAVGDQRARPWAATGRPRRRRGARRCLREKARSSNPGGAIAALYAAVPMPRREDRELSRGASSSSATSAGCAHRARQGDRHHDTRDLRGRGRAPRTTSSEQRFRRLEHGSRRGWRRAATSSTCSMRARAQRLLVAATGAGKTLAGFLPTICDLVETPAEGLHTLYVSPLKALAVDVQRNLLAPIEEMGLADPRRDPHRRHAVRPQGAPAGPPAADPADHARIAEPAAQLSRQRDSVRGPQDRRRRRNPRLRPGEARRPAVAVDRPAADAGARTCAASACRATVADPDAYRGWLAPDADIDAGRPRQRRSRRRARPVDPDPREPDPLVGPFAAVMPRAR